MKSTCLSSSFKDFLEQELVDLQDPNLDQVDSANQTQEDLVEGASLTPKMLKLLGVTLAAAA